MPFNWSSVMSIFDNPEAQNQTKELHAEKLKNICHRDLKLILLRKIKDYQTYDNPKPNEATIVGMLKVVLGIGETGRMRAELYQDKISNLASTKINLSFRPDEVLDEESLLQIKNQFRKQQEIIDEVLKDIDIGLADIVPENSSTSKMLCHRIAEGLCEYFNINLHHYLENQRREMDRYNFGNTHSPPFYPMQNISQSAIVLVEKAQMNFNFSIKKYLTLMQNNSQTSSHMSGGLEQNDSALRGPTMGV